MIGSEFGRYKVVERLGAGGMGEVYRAEDTTLGRPVALKFLAAHLLNEDEAKQRFLREAKAAAAITHPNICHVYEVAEEGGKTFLAMTYLEGESLEDRVAKGPLPLKDALDIGRQIAEGLEAAHEKGIVHRDIKPANVMIDAKGRATILDFGLARLTEASKLTRADQTVGTAAYMSPEQIQGAEVDHRTDVWALGCVLYEMVAGLRPFKGQYDQALLYEVIHEEPEPLTAIRAGVPMELEFIVGKCLAKDREDRYHAAKEIAVDLRTLAEKLKSGRSAVLRASQMTGAMPTSTAQTLNPVATLSPDGVFMPHSRQRLLYALLAVTTLAFLAVAAVYFTQAPPAGAEQPVRRFSFVLPRHFNGDAAISPNGRHIVFTTAGTDGGLWVQDLDQDEPRRLAGTEGASQPFWSPDSESIGYATNVELRRIAVQGGASGLVCALPGRNFGRGTCSPDGESIVFASYGGSVLRASLFTVPVQGGSAEEILTPSSYDGSASDPAFVRGANARLLLYAIGGAAGSTLYIKNLDTGQTADLGPGDRPIYSSATGNVIYQAGRGASDLWARPFSPETLSFTGPAFPLRQDALVPSLADDGTLVYLDGVSVSRNRTLVWRDRSGVVLETVSQAQPTIFHPSLSPDGRRAAVSSREGDTDHDIWVHDLARSTKTRLTFDPGLERTAVWSPSGDQIVYWQWGANGSSLMRKSADGSGEAVALVDAEENLATPDWSRNGRYLIYGQDPRDGAGGDLRYVEIGRDGKAGEPVTFLATSADEGTPKFSPDGRFVAYLSDESGQREVYVRPFPEGAGRWQASVDGGSQLRWSRDGKELFFVRDDRLLSVSVSTGQGITLGEPQELFNSDDLRSYIPVPTYDVSPDGRRFLMVEPVEPQQSETAPPKIRVVLNWYEEFRGRKQD